MEYYRTLDVNVTCLEGFQAAKNMFFKRQKIYATVSISGSSSRTTQKTPMGKFHGNFQKWDYPMRFYIDESMLKKNYLVLVIRLRSSPILCRDKDVGEVCVPIKQLFDCNDDNNGHNCSGYYQVFTPSGKPKGGLQLSSKFSDLKRSSSSSSLAMIEDVNCSSSLPTSSNYKALPSAPYCYSLDFNL